MAKARNIDTNFFVIIINLLSFGEIGIGTVGQGTEQVGGMKEIDQFNSAWDSPGPF